MPQFMLLLHDPGSFPEDMSPDDMQAVIRRYIAWRERVAQRGRHVTGHKLREGEGRVMRGTGNATTVTDGPYAEAREVIGGLFILDAADYEDAVALARDCPHLEFGPIEVREIEPTS